MILYLTSQGADVHIEEGRLIIQEADPGGVRRSIPKEQIDAIYVFGQIQLTTGAIRHCLTRGIPVSFFSTKGKYFGKLYTTSHGNIFRLKRQVEAAENEDFALGIAKKFVAAKSNNQITILRRQNRANGKMDSKIREIQILRRKLDSVATVPELMGYEGSIARIYFRGLSKSVPQAFAFCGRNKQPPRDSFNSLLSLGYSILLNEIVGNLEAVGLHPFCGFLHQDRERHMTLASDMIEELRAPIVDSLAIKLCNHVFSPEDFEIQNGGCFLKQETLKIFLRELEEKLMRLQNYRQDENPMSFRKALGLQSRDLVRAIEDMDPERYTPLWIR